MDEACNKALCREAAACVCQGEGQDHPDAASYTSPSASGASSGLSSCSLTPNLGDGLGYLPSEDHSSESSSASSSTLQLDSEAEGPLYELSSLLAQLPARRGLSKYYQGKSQSFTSISYATCLQDLGKEVTYSKRMKTCKSNTAGSVMNQRSNHLPRTCNKMIAKRPSKSSFACQMSRASSTNLLYRSANLPAHQNKEDVQMHMNS
ncbi:hypothetical protein CFC21_032032 [Triticum aestivum]|uniref:Oxidative stress 3 n=2 Tax=Triticum aestivum TaxID=4565 RepID=A0A9R1EXY8_WHEAT|nr:uncharacterized protein LOC123054797 [Triticum aestivum]KAF7018783.1 hypothetical protein CFC21_032032 [Triticum aestivum]